MGRTGRRKGGNGEVWEEKGWGWRGERVEMGRTKRRKDRCLSTLIPNDALLQYYELFEDMNAYRVPP